MSTVFVSGGAGYVGSHTVLALAAAGYDAVVYDNLSFGHPEAVDRIQAAFPARSIRFLSIWRPWSRYASEVWSMRP